MGEPGHRPRSVQLTHTRVDEFSERKSDCFQEKPKDFEPLRQEAGCSAEFCAADITSESLSAANYVSELDRAPSQPSTKIAPLLWSKPRPPPTLMGSPQMSLLPHGVLRGQHPLSPHHPPLPLIITQIATKKRVGGNQWRRQMLVREQSEGGPAESHESHFQLYMKWKFL